ncbi:MAG: hypothetical protein HC942_00690 [Microcoleus sp. SU_5_6]|nr:hypothetical protein [Microcoleus sp. SU_5_6]NJS12753.1 hypothetical protein [Microcoleus sp. CSU_2_2]
MYDRTYYQLMAEYNCWMNQNLLFNHQTHHRGQVTTLIKQLGYEPGLTDIPWLPTLNATV